MGNKAKDDDLYQEMCRVVGKVVLEMRDLGQEPKHIVIAGVCAPRWRTAKSSVRRSPWRLWRKSFMRFPGTEPLRRRVRKSRSGSPP
jgi:hypothetical protein